MQLTPVHLGLVGLMLLSWIILLAGMSAVQQSINSTLDVGSWELALWWFILFLTLALIIAYAVLAVTHELRKRLAIALIALFSIISVIWLQAAQWAYNWMRAISRFPDQGTPVARFNTMIAGASMLFIALFFAILALAWDHSDDSAAAGSPSAGKPTASAPPPQSPAGSVPLSNINPSATPGASYVSTV